MTGWKTVNLPERECIYQGDPWRLDYYAPMSGVPAQSTPVILCFALINRPWILDFSVDRSLIKTLQRAGFCVYLIDWGYPQDQHAQLGLTDYIQDFLNLAVDQVCSQQNTSSVSLIGICQGGVLSLCYAALYPQKIKKLVLWVTPIDFHTEDNVLAKTARYLHPEKFLQLKHVIPGSYINQGLLYLKPDRLLGQPWITWMVEGVATERWQEAQKMEQWIFDTPNHPAKAFAEWIDIFYQKNSLMRQTFVLDKTPIHLEKLTAPVLGIYATEDHLVPLSSQQALESLLPAVQYQGIYFQGGHIGSLVSKKAGKEIYPRLLDYLKINTSLL